MFVFILLLIVIISSNTIYAESNIDNGNINTDNNETNTIQLIKKEPISDLANSVTYNITAGSNSSTIQNTINQMKDGDILNFENGTYTNICIYIDKNITVNGNGAILIGLNSPGVNNSNIPDAIKNTTATGGYAIGNLATLYVLGTTNANINNFNLVGLNTSYSSTVLYAKNSKNLKILNNTINGGSWGIYLQQCPQAIIESNTFKKQVTTGLLSFGSKNGKIINNTVINATNHGIDVRHGTGPNVTVQKNTIINSKEGIYLMHSTGHTALDNTIINSTISAITVYGAGNINIYNNTLKGSRIGVLLASGFYNVTVGNNSYKLDKLSFPPTFPYYVCIADQKYQSSINTIGTYSDRSIYPNDYRNKAVIDEIGTIEFDYNSLLNRGKVFNVNPKMTSEDIQSIIYNMKDGDILNFTKDTYNNICIYVDKNIEIRGNGAILIGLDSFGVNNIAIPEKIRNTTANGGYAIGNGATLYVVNCTNTKITGLTIKGLNTEYSTAALYGYKAINLTIYKNTIIGGSWGMYINNCPNYMIVSNQINNQITTGLLSFGSKNGKIVNNTVINATNHGIDVRHGTGPNVTVQKNTIINSKEGIYLMHSYGHTTNNNTIINSSISSITVYGAGNINIYNNILKGSPVGFLLASGFYNVTIDKNTYKLDSLPFPPTFPYYISIADQGYQSANNIIGTYNDLNYITTIKAENLIKYNGNASRFYAKLVDSNGNPLKGMDLSISIYGRTYNRTTDENGTASIGINLASGNYPIEVLFKGKDNYAKSSFNGTVTILPTISGNNVVKIYKNSTPYYATFLNSDGTLLTNKNVTVNIYGIFYTRETNSNGVARLNINLNPGKYIITAINPISKEMYSNNITVLSSISGNNIVKYYHNGTQYYATFVNSDGTPLANRNVTFNIYGVFYTRATNDKGIAKLNINLNPGEYIITAINPVNGQMYSNKIKVLPTLLGKNLVKKYGTPSPYEVRLVDGQGIAINGASIRLNIYGVFYNRNTDANGIAKLNINLMPGEYIVTAYYKDAVTSNTIKVEQN